MSDRINGRPLMLNQRKKRSPLFFVGSVLLGVVIFALILFAVFNFWVNQNCFLVEVSGDSMLNTVEDGDLLYVREHKAKRGDIVIISVKDCRGEGGFHFSGDYIIKRVIAFAGDTVKWENGDISIKYAESEEFAVLNEPYIRGETPSFDSGNVIEVKEGEIFFLGDNRENSYDSTEIGCLKESYIVGVVPKWSLKIKSFTNFWERMRTRVAVHQ